MTSLAAAAALAVLASGAALPAGATPSDRSLPTPAEREVAEQALTALQRTKERLAGDPVTGAQGRDTTVLRRDLFVTRDDLAPTDQVTAQRVLARPAAGQDDCGTGEPGQNSPFCIHWVATGTDAPPPGDTSPANGIPDQVDRTRTTLATVWERVVTQGGYKAPLPDTGSDGRFDVYLSDIGADGLYGQCTPSEPRSGTTRSPFVYSAYCELDNDYRSGQFPDPDVSPLENLQVTAAHEFFHAVQFAYDTLEDGWFLEGTAAWVEDEVFDAVNDNRQYLAKSPLAQPGMPLDRAAGLDIYGSWIWWRYLSETFSDRGSSGLPLVVRRVWERASAEGVTDPNALGVYSMKALDGELASRGTGLATQLANFSVANRQPAAFYEEGAAYAPAPLRGSFTIGKGSKRSGQQTVSLNHLTSATYSLNHGAGLRGSAWTVQVRVDMPNRTSEPRALLTSVPADGGARSTVAIKLNRKGVGSGSVGFGSAVRAVEVTLVNGGHRYRCLRGTQYACEGAPRDDGRRTTFSATAVRHTVS